MIGYFDKIYKAYWQLSDIGIQIDIRSHNEMPLTVTLAATKSTHPGCKV